jgi:hypothetical protein
MVEKRKRTLIKPSAQSDRNRTKFRQLLRGKCFNCLASDHLVAQCRDPTKCWNCKRYGHIAARCNRKVTGEGRRPDNISMRSCSYASPPHSKKQSHNIKPSWSVLVHSLPFQTSQECPGCHQWPDRAAPAPKIP